MSKCIHETDCTFYTPEVPGELRAERDRLKVVNARLVEVIKNVRRKCAVIAADHLCCSRSPVSPLAAAAAVAYLDAALAAAGETKP